MRSKLPFTAARVRVEGHKHQGDGATERNLRTLRAAVLQAPNPNIVADFLAVAMTARRRHRSVL